MREEMKLILKSATRSLALREREKEGSTQEKMAEELFMSKRSYADIECGVNACSALTTVLLLMRLPSADAFLLQLKQDFEKTSNQ